MKSFEKLALTKADQKFITGGFLGIGRKREVIFEDINSDGIIDKVVNISNSKTGKWIKSHIYLG